MTSQGSSSAMSELADIATARADLASLLKTAAGTNTIRIDWYDHGSPNRDSSGDGDNGSGGNGNASSSSSGVGESLWNAFSPLFDLGSKSSSKARSSFEGLALFAFLGRLGEGASDGGGGSSKDLWEAFGPLVGAGVDGIAETLLPEGFSNPLAWPTVKTGLGLLKFFIGLGVNGAGDGATGGDGLLPDGRGLGPGGLNAIAREDTASPLGAGAGVLANLISGGVGRPMGPAGGNGVDQSITFNAPVNGDVQSAILAAHKQQTANTRVMTTSGVRAI